MFTYNIRNYLLLILLKHNDGTIEGGLTHLIIGDKK